MFKSSPAMKIQIANAILFGTVQNHRFEVSHMQNVENDFVFALKNPARPAPAGEYDLTLDLAMHINKDNSVVVESPSRLVYAHTNINEDPEFFAKIHQTYVTFVEHEMRRQLETSPETAGEFMTMTDEQKNEVLIHNSFVALQASPRFLAAAMPQEEPEAEPETANPLPQAELVEEEPQWEEMAKESEEVSAACRQAEETVH